MKRTLITLLLVVAFAILAVCGILLYRTLNSAIDTSIKTIDSAVESSDVVTAEETPEAVPVGEDVTPDPEEDGLEPAVDFALTDREGNTVRLSDYYGKPIILNFWATWCGPCQMELPYFDAAYARYGDQIQFMMVDLVDGSYDTQESTISFAESNGYTFPLFFDIDMAGAEAYEVNAIPMTVVINADGKLVTTHIGSLSEAELQELIDLVI